jgi:hypothetical protein
MVEITPKPDIVGEIHSDRGYVFAVTALLKSVNILFDFFLKLLVFVFLPIEIVVQIEWRFLVSMD